jgi:hypothetical protein
MQSDHLNLELSGCWSAEIEAAFSAEHRDKVEGRGRFLRRKPRHVADQAESSDEIRCVSRLIAP